MTTKQMWYSFVIALGFMWMYIMLFIILYKTIPIPTVSTYNLMEIVSTTDDVEVYALIEMALKDDKITYNEYEKIVSAYYKVNNIIYLDSIKTIIK